MYWLLHSRFVVAVVALLSSGAATLAQSPAICIVSAGNRTTVAAPNGAFSLRGIPTSGTPIRITTMCQRPDLTSFGSSEYFLVRRNINYQVQNLIAAPTPPRSLVRVFTSRPGSSQAPITQLGFQEQLFVGGQFNDGSASTNLNGVSNGTTYVSSNPEVLMVDDRGRVTAMGDGAAFITTLNDGAVSSTRFEIFTGPPTTVAGLVWREDGTPVSGATISIFGNQTITATSGPDGSFSLPGVLGTAATTVTVRARITIGTDNFRGSAVNLPFVPSGITDAGIIRVTLAPAGPGPIIASGMDPEDHGFPTGAGGVMIRDIISFCVRNSFLRPAPSRVLMIGGSGGVVTGTTSIITGLGYTVTTVTGTAIATADLNPATTPYDIIYMPTSNDEVSGGLTAADLARVNARSADIVNFVNSGGGVASFAQTLTGGYAWFPLGGLQTSTSGLAGTIVVTTDGSLILSPSATNVTPFHQAFTGPNGFFGLKVLATEGSGSRRPLIIGGIAELP